jgi:HemY protein
MVAVAAGDPEEANSQARRADALLNEPPLTMLLSAQAAQLNGDEAAASRYFNDMLERPETAFLGLRGLYIQAQKSDDPRAALEYAERAYQLQPKTPWVLNTMFELQVADKQWQAALATLDEAVKKHVVSADSARTRRAIVLLGCSIEAESVGDLAEALRFSKRANSLSPDFLPVVLHNVDLLIKSGKTRRAVRFIHAAWSKRPHPDLAKAYAKTDDQASEDALKQVKLFERLLSYNPDHAESHIALANAAVNAELWGEARNHLEKVTVNKPSARICRLMADLEEGAGDDVSVAHDWLLRATAALPDEAWVCGDCGAAWAAWSPVCGNCEGLGTLDWAVPAHANEISLLRDANIASKAGAPFEDETIEVPSASDLKDGTTVRGKKPQVIEGEVMSIDTPGTGANNTKKN